jgi:hypothetical protein
MPWLKDGNKLLFRAILLASVTCRDHSFAADACTPEEARAWVDGPSHAFGVTNAATMM